MKEKECYVIKANNERELFDQNKIKASLIKAKIPLEYVDRILTEIEEELYDNIPTREIYTLILQRLGKIYPSGEIRFRLKKAIMELGPTGYPFEIFVGHLLNEFGYETQIGVEIAGECVTHEVDVLAKKDNRVYFVECKYHNQQGVHSDVKTTLYVYARGKDLMAKSGNDKTYGTWIFTNTRFSADAISYAECKQMRLTGWGYPNKKDCLQAMIEEKNLYPITALYFLTTEQKKLLLQQNVVLIKELLENQSLQRQIGLNTEAIEKLNEV